MSRDSIETTNTTEENFKKLYRLADLTIDEPSKERIRNWLSKRLRIITLPQFCNDELEDGISDSSKSRPSNPATIPIENLTCPLRMFDIDTMNIVEVSRLDPDDRYCVLSHSWKGAEIDYKYFCRATKRDDQRPELRQSDISDVDMLDEQCGLDLAWVVTEMRRTSTLQLDQRFQEYLQDKKLREDLRSAEQTEAEAKKNRATAVEQQENANKILMGMKHSAIEDWVAVAEEYVEIATNMRQVVQGERARFVLENGSSRGNAMESLLKCLQRIRSLRKVKESISKARNIFDTREFPNFSKRYLWLDTCCVDKSDSGELTKSLALMGEWYANADFCVVHLDTENAEDDWMEEWKIYDIDFTTENWMDDWKTRINQTPAWTHKANVLEFNEIKDANIRWATRGWTLQELVLSKMTFFFNSQWAELKRTIDQLGPYYYLTPFLDHYLRHADLPFGNALIELQRMWQSLLPEKENNDEDFMKVKIEKLVFLLRALQFFVPRHLSVQTSESQIEKAIWASSVDNLRAQIGHTTEIPPCDERDLIIFILMKLQDIAQRPIRLDRQEISGFSKIATLKNWTQGTSPTDNSAYNVLIASSIRNTEVPTDKAYALMGILNVRFPAFPAEGLPRALSRLFDEKIIVSNDISIFNWSGKYFGSAIQGRSLYPSCIEAYQNHAAVASRPGDRDINKLVLDISGSDRPKKERIIKLIVGILLNDMFKLVKAMDYKALHDGFIEVFVQLITSIRLLPLDELEKVNEELGDLQSKIMDLSESYEKEKRNKKQHRHDSEENISGSPNECQKDEVRPHVEEEESQRNTQCEIQPTAENNASCSPNEYQEDNIEPPREEEGSQKKGSRLGIRRKVAKMTSELSAPMNKLVKNESPLSLLDKLKAKKTPETPKEPSEFEKKMSVFRNELEEIEKRLNGMKKVSPEADEHSISFTVTDSIRKPLDFTALESKCHNPIVISSSGISGTFDIQRIFVTMLDPKQLRAQIKKSVSGQTIEGWCTVSTGFAYLLVNFNCEKDILEQQLDMSEVIQETLLKDPRTELILDYPLDETSSIITSTPLGETMEKVKEKQKEKQDDSSISGEAGGIKKEQSDAQRLLVKCIDMIQEPDLHAVAGEWVLARFSDVPAAEWFLGRLELGTGNKFYARRISTDGFTFANAIPSKGLTEYWEQVMMGKKDIACDALLYAMESKRMRHDADNYVKGKEQKDTESSKGSDSQARTSLIPTVIQKLAKGAARLGAWSIHQIADDMIENVDSYSLKNVPSQLHSAVLALGSTDLEGLKPAMFRSGINIHMF